MQNLINNKYLYTLILISLLLHIVSANYSIGFYSDDEHFQILEIAAYLLGINEVAINDTSSYYWEWKEKIRMRPWFQPYFYFKFISFLKIFIEDNPFFWALCIRIFSSILGFGSIIYLFFVLKDYFFKSNIKFNYLLFFTFWFYPFLHSRTSAENLSLSLFLISFCILFQISVSEKYKFNSIVYSFASFLLGISMVAKFTTVFTALPIFIWLLCYRFNFYKIFIFGFFVLLALSFGLYIDYLNWGSFKNTYYQFYLYNLGAGEVGRMKYFGVDPWYYYIIEIIKQLAPILSLFFFIGLVIFWLKNLKSIITWITFITLVVFSAIGHKEIRYIFPIYIFAPFFVAYFFENFSLKYFSLTLKYLVIISNIIFLLITLITPANSKVGVYKFIYDNVGKEEKVFYSDENPYLVNNMEAHFYTNFLPKIKKINLKNKNLKDKNIWVTTNNYNDISILLEKNCIIEYTTYPRNIVNLNDNWKRLKLNWYVFYCR